MALQTLARKRGTYLGTINGSARVASAQAINSGQTLTFDVDTSDFDNLTVVAQQTGAASGDLTVTVAPFETDGVTAFPLGLTAAVATGPTYDGSANVNYVGQFDLRGVQAVRVSVKNNNAAAKTINFIDVFAGITGVDY